MDENFDELLRSIRNLNGGCGVGWEIDAWEYLTESYAVGRVKSAKECSAWDFLYNINSDSPTAARDVVKEFDKEAEEMFAEGIDERRLYYFNERMSLLFDREKLSSEMDDNCLVPFPKDTKQLIDQLLTLYIDVCATEVEYVPSSEPTTIVDLGPINHAGACAANYLIVLRRTHFDPGVDVSKFFADATIVPPLVAPFVRCEDGKYTVAKNDTSGLDYKLALLSCMMFCSKKNYDLFLLKCEKYLAEHASV